MHFGTYGDVDVQLGEDFVAELEIRRPPDNFFDRALIASLSDALEALDGDGRCRASVLCSQGKHFCAGADFRGRPLRLENDTETLDGSRMQESVSSIVVHDGTWQLCSRPAFEGRCRTFEPGRYATMAGMDDRVASAKLLR